MEPATTRRLIALALPAAASVVLNNAFRVIDQYAVQWLGVDAQAAVGACTFVLIACFALFVLVSAGAGPLVARAAGAGDVDAQRRVVGNALTCAGLMGVLVLVTLGFSADGIAILVGLEGGPAVQMGTYLKWLAIFGLPLALAPTVDSIFIARGETGAVLGLQVVATGLNLALNPWCIYTLDLGIGGAALATGLSRAVAVAIGMWLLWRRVGPRRRDLVPAPVVRRIAKVGWPVSLNMLYYAGVYWALMAVAISPLGPEVNAALGIGFSALEGFSWPVFWGVSKGISSLVGRHLGAGQPEQAVRTYYLAIPLMGALGLVAGLVFYFGAVPMCGLFTEDPLVLEHAIVYARVLAFSQIFVAWEAMTEGVLLGSGHTRPVLQWSAPINLLRIPLGWLAAFPLGFGAMGIWWVINLTTMAKCLGKWSVVHRGAWRDLRI